MAGCTQDQVLCMSSVTSGLVRIELPPTIRSLLGRVRARLRRDALLAGMLCRWDCIRNRLIPVASAPGCVYLTEPSPGLWVVGHAASVYRVRLH